MINLGTLELADAYIGSTPIEKAYLGSTLVWEKYNGPVNIEYLRGDGNAYMTIPFSSSSATTTFTLELIADQLASGASMMGSRTASNRRFCWVLSPEATLVQVGYGSNYRNVSIAISVGDVIRCETTIANSSIQYTISNLTKGTSASVSWATSSFSVSSFVYLFWSGALNKSKCSVKKLVIANNGTDVVDCVPIRIGQTGYMYDRISENLIGNSGTGSFTLGPDVT